MALADAGMAGIFEDQNAHASFLASRLLACAILLAQPAELSKVLGRLAEDLEGQRRQTQFV
jgi:hypothetical protein